MARTSEYLPSFFPTGSSYFTPTHHPDLNSVFPTDNEINNNKNHYRHHDANDDSDDDDDDDDDSNNGYFHLMLTSGFMQSHKLITSRVLTIVKSIQELLSS